MSFLDFPLISSYKVNNLLAIHFSDVANCLFVIE